MFRVEVVTCIRGRPGYVIAPGGGGGGGGDSERDGKLY